jgi:flagellar biosynthesis protein FlhF
MRLKSYFAGTVEAAVVAARRELGPEAVLMDSHKAGPEARHLGEYEVVFSAAPVMEPVPEQPSPYPHGAEMESGRKIRFTDEVAELRQQMERMAAAIKMSSSVVSARMLPSTAAAEAFSTLVASEVNPDLARDIAGCIAPNGESRGGAEKTLAAELERRFRVDASAGRADQNPRVLALVGPPGSGKTTTLVKLAAVHGLTARKPTQIISMDNYRVGSADQLRTYAAILGVGFQALETPGALAQALEEFRHKHLILIDTPGYGPKEMDSAWDLARFLATHPLIDTHLTLTPSMKSADLSRVVDRFEIFRPRKLLFTRLDETESFGSILNEAARTRKPVSFLTFGQRIPEDLEAATKSRIVELLLTGRTAQAAAAA